MIDSSLSGKQEYESYPATRTNYVRMVEGLMLSVWDKINPPIQQGQIVTSNDENRMREEIAKRKLIRIRLDDGTDVIGRRFVDLVDYQEMLARFGQATDDIAEYNVRIQANQVQVVDMLLETGLLHRIKQRFDAPSTHFTRTDLYLCRG